MLSTLTLEVLPSISPSQEIASVAHSCTIEDPPVPTIVYLTHNPFGPQRLLPLDSHLILLPKHNVRKSRLLLLLLLLLPLLR